MKPGPKQLPRNMRLVLGTRTNSDREHPKNPPPEPAIAVPHPPEFLSEEERAAFTRQAIKLAGMRVMTEMDVELLAIFARNWVLWQQSWKRIDATDPLSKMVVVTKNGHVMENPLYSVMKKAQLACERILIEFGCSPSSRNRVSM